MSTQANIKQKLKLLETAPIAQVVMDVVSECLQDMNADESIGVGEQALSRYSQRILKRLAGKYRSQLKVEDTI